jgi:hypothetical protein
VDGKGCASAAYRSNVTELASLRLRQSAGQTLCKHRIVESQGETHSHAQTEPLGQVNVLGTIDRYHHFVCGDLPRQLLDSQRLGFRARIAQVNVASLGDREEDNGSAIWRETRSPHHTHAIHDPLHRTILVLGLLLPLALLGRHMRLDAYGVAIPAGISTSLSCGQV